VFHCFEGGYGFSQDFWRRFPVAGGDSADSAGVVTDFVCIEKFTTTNPFQTTQRVHRTPPLLFVLAKPLTIHQAGLSTSKILMIPLACSITNCLFCELHVWWQDAANCGVEKFFVQVLASPENGG
jgi:hypothetical protein